VASTAPVTTECAPRKKSSSTPVLVTRSDRTLVSTKSIFAAAARQSHQPVGRHGMFDAAAGTRTCSAARSRFGIVTWPSVVILVMSIARNTRSLELIPNMGTIIALQLRFSRRSEVRQHRLCLFGAPTLIGE
jgi:hypothetical protein